MAGCFISGYFRDVGTGRKFPDGCQEARDTAAEINTAVKCVFYLCVSD